MPPARLAPVAALLFYGLSATAFVAGCHDGDVPQPASSATPAPRASAPPSVDASLAAVGAEVPLPFVPEKISAEGRAMGTHIAFAAFTTEKLNKAQITQAFDDALHEIQRVDRLMTTWRPDSDLSKVNAAAGTGQKVAIDPETFGIVENAIHTSEISDGTFDITFESLHGLWKFDEDLDPHPPTLAAVRAKLPLVNYHHVHLDAGAHTVMLDKAGVKISLGGIAKGYAVDRAAKVLDDAGLPSFYVQAGGDLFARGKKPDGSPWQAAVRDPRGPEGSYFAVLDLSDHAFSTAGDYERSYVVGEKRYHHIIDPRTGFPATASRSVTIWAKTALLADGIDDAVFILGPEKGLALVESLDDVAAVIVDAKNKVWISKRLEGRVRMTRAPTDGL